MNIAPSDVRDVRDAVRDSVRPVSLVAVGLCGTCGTAPLRGRVRASGLAAVRHPAIPTRAYGCPHIPHIPHNACAATFLRDSVSAHQTAHPALALARAFSSVTACLKEMEEEVAGYGF